MKNETVFSYANKSNPKGIFRQIPKENLIVPEKYYQRPAVSDRKVKEIADNWDWVLCGAIRVAEYDKKMYVMEGGHRVRGAKELNGTIKTLPCMVYKIDSLTDQARAFLGCAKKRTAIKSYENHKAGLIANDPMAIKVEQIVTDCGYFIGPTGDFSFAAVRALESCVKVDYEIAQTAFWVCSEIAGGDRIYKEVLLGIFEVEYRSKNQLKGGVIENSRNLSVLKKAGMDGIIQKINKIKALAGSSTGGNSRSISAGGVLDVLNKNLTKRNKYKIVI
jgi:hypothetical protein